MTEKVDLYQTLPDKAESNQLITLEPEDDNAKDKHNLAYYIMVLMGTGFLFPFNTVIMAVDFYQEVLPDYQIEYFVTAVFNYPAIVIMALMIKFGNVLSFSIRIITCFIVFGISLIIMSFCTNIVSSEEGIFAFILIFTFIIGSTTAVLQSSIFGFASILPPLYNQAVMAGLGVAGFTVAVSRIFTKLWLELQTATRLYFIISALVSFICVAGYLTLIRLPFYLYHKNSQKSIEAANLLSTTSTPNPSVTVPNDEEENTSHFFQNQAMPGYQSPAAFSFRKFLDRTVTPMEESEDQQNLLKIPESPSQKSSLWKIFLKIWPMAFSSFFVMCITFILYPGMQSEFTPTSGLDFGWFCVILFTIWNGADFIFRMLPKWFRYLSPPVVFWTSIGRLIFIPLYAVVVSRPDVFNNGSLSGDIYAYLITFLMAMTNGYCCTLAMMYGPDVVFVNEKESAGYIMSFLLNFGIFTGTHLGLFFKYFMPVPPHK